MSTELRFEAALQRYLDGDHTLEDETLLVRAIQSEPNARVTMLLHLELDELLRQHEQRDREAFVDALRLRLECRNDEWFVQSVITAAEQRHRPQQVHPSSWRRLILAAAATLVLSGLGWMRWRHETFTDQSEATALPAKPAETQLEQFSMPDLEPMPVDDDTVTKVGDEPRLFMLPSRVSLFASPSAALTLESDMLLRLDGGRVAADAGPRGKGFTVRTPQAKIVDIGTKFGVHARPTGVTDVIVWSGAVLLTPTGVSKATKLTTGQSVSVDANGNLLRLASVTVPEEWQLWSSEPSAEQCIARVEEVALKTDMREFFRILPGALQDGTMVSLGRSEHWGAVTGKSFPSELIGADVVQLPYASRLSVSWPLAVKVQRPSTIYLFIPQSSVAPGWLEKAFKRTTLQIGSVVVQGGKPRVRVSSLFEVWKRSVNEPCTITLGTPLLATDGKPGLPYGIAAKPH